MHRTGTFYKEFESKPEEIDVQREATVKIPKAPPFPKSIPTSSSNALQHGNGEGGMSQQFSLLPAMKGVPKIVMDPLAVLRQCIRFFSCHPEIYGTNMRSLLDKEVMEVMRLKSSEAAIAQQQPVSSSHDMATAVEMLAKPLLPPIQSAQKGVQSAGAHLLENNNHKANPSLAAAAKAEEGMLGYGALTFMPMKEDFAALIDKFGRVTSSHDSGSNPGGSGTAVKASTAVTANESANTAVTTETAVPVNSTASGGGGGIAGAGSGGVPGGDGTLNSTIGGGSELRSTHSAPFSSSAAARNILAEQVSSMTGLMGANGGDSGPIIVDANGYEVSYLRRQLQQIEAAYNAKCIRLHELVEENTRLDAQLRIAEETSEKWLTQYRESHAMVDALRREVEGWQEKAYKAELHNGGGDDSGIKTTSKSQRRRTATMQELNKTEVERMTRLWRETEKALQEARRQLENSEKEANATHDHLSDAFLYIERLERRIARRDRFIDIAARRQRSMEEKYEKLMWCMREIGTMTGAHSFVDHLLCDDPIWSLFVFQHMQRHVGDMYSMDESVMANSTDKSLLFARSNGGGRLMDERYDTPLIYHLMADEATGLTERRGKRKRLRTNLHGAVGCKVLRWENLYVLDYLGGEDTMPNTTEMNKKKLPLLTLASLTQPLRKANGVRVDAILPSPKKERGGGLGVAPKPKKEEETFILPEDFGPANTFIYDQATIRLLIRNFWRERVEQFESTMRQRISRCMTRARKAKAAQAFNDLSDMLNADESEDDEYAEELGENIPNTFLAALVVFVYRLCGKPISSKEDETPILIAVRGMVSKDPNLWDDGRLFFAHIADSKIRTATVLDGPIPNGPELTGPMREMICAMYYYTMEYKDSDSDFRLFYLVSHQMIPESVGINFYACIEAFQADCEKMLRENLTPPSQETVLEALRKEAMSYMEVDEPFTIIEDEKHDGELLSPMEAVAKTAQIIDRAPVVQEGVEIEEDSDEDGYGSILPGSKEKGSRAPNDATMSFTQQSIEQSEMASPNPIVIGLAPGPSPLCPPLDMLEPVAQQSTSQSLDQSSSSFYKTGSVASFARKGITHGILEYLETMKHRRSEAQEKEYQKRSEAMEAKLKKTPVEDPREPWEHLDKEIHRIFAPHSKVSKDYRDIVLTRPKDSLFQHNRKRRLIFDDLDRKSLAATRGLLPQEDVLMLFHKHCFATYAVTCCGTPRFHFPCAVEEEGTERGDYYDAFSRIGMMPPLPIHLQRLRAALALDQPSTLINYRQLFSTDVNTFTPTHFYDEFLTLTLDYFLQQQNFFMNTVLTSCSARHERYSVEGAEECDGNVPIATLKSGFIHTLASINFTPEQSTALVEHLQHYHELLRLEDDIKLEQFTDAPFLFDSEAAPDNDEEDEEEPATEWQFEDEAMDCSLLQLSLAIRMLYPVWSLTCTVQANRLADILSKWTPITKVNQSKSQVPSIIQVNAPSTPIAKELQERYMIAAKRLAEGNSGNYNPLRVTARWIAEEERVKEEVSKDASSPEAYEYHFEVPLDKQLEHGLYPNWHTLRQIFTKAWKIASLPESKPPSKAKAKPVKAGAAAALARAQESKDNQPAVEVAVVDPVPVRDWGLFVLSRSMGTSRSYVIKGNTGKKNSKKHFVFPFGVELQLQLQSLHFRNSVSMLQASRTLFQSFLRDVHFPAPKKVDGAAEGAVVSIGRRRGSVDKAAVTLSARRTSSNLVVHPSQWTPAFRAGPPTRFAAPARSDTTVASTGTPTKSSGRSSKRENEEKMDFFVEDLRGCLAALSMI